MEPIITLTSPLDTITLSGTNIAGGYIYDNDALDSWLKLAEVDAKFNKRPNAHGAYTPDQLFTKEHRWVLPGRYFGTSSIDATYARNRLSALFADGKAIAASVTDDIGTTFRTVFTVVVEPEWMPDHQFTFALEFSAPDPRRYGAARTPQTGLATAGSGLVWPLGTGASFWDWGTAGTSGRVSFTNAGNTTTYPVILVGQGGGFASGFSLTEVQTGRTLTYSADTGTDVVRLDNRTQRATVNGADVTRNLTRREWFAVPPGGTYEYQLVTLGATTGAPQAQLVGSDAYL